MINLDMKFLRDVGLGDIPKESSHKILDNYYRELQTRVGEIIMTGMSDEQLDEFDIFIKKNAPAMKKWYAQHEPDYQDSQYYRELKEKNPTKSETWLMSDVGCKLWLDRNRPDHAEVVHQVFETMRAELLDAVPRLREACQLMDQDSTQP
ncbi:MAG: DUF5663 domain-containing protein [Propionibacteriaceae bacterium]|nr:DUF5663 domain-containing protein [Propionibacteriaceae bacterium]